MRATRFQRFQLASLLAWLLVFAGAALALTGILLDVISPTSSPGISLPQILITALGAVMAVAGWLLRSERVRQRLWTVLRANLKPIVIVTLVTFLCIEIALALTGRATYYPAILPESDRQPVDWWGCDEIGCRYVVDAATRACESGVLTARHCIFNSLGFADNDEFVAADHLDERDRILFLGDSFTQGFTADVGKSFVETVELAMPDAAIWNLGATGSGTNQALASFRAIAPIMRPKLTVLGFLPFNDFTDNQLPLDALAACALPTATAWAGSTARTQSRVCATAFTALCHPPTSWSGWPA